MNALDFPTKYCLSASDKARLLEKAKRNGQTPDAYVEILITRDLFATLPPVTAPRKPRKKEVAHV